MQESSYSFLLKLVAGIFIWATTNIYIGAFAIAILSATTRIVYESEQNIKRVSIAKKALRYFVLSLSLAILFVHIGIMYKWSEDTTIVISAVFAFMSEETLRFILKNWELVLVKISSRAGK